MARDLYRENEAIFETLGDLVDARRDDRKTLDEHDRVFQVLVPILWIMGILVTAALAAVGTAIGTWLTR